MLESSETSMLSHPVEAAERRLELLGPVWRAPSLMEVLRQLPFLRGQPQSVLEFFVRWVVQPVFSVGAGFFGQGEGRQGEGRSLRLRAMHNNVSNVMHGGAGSCVVGPQLDGGAAAAALPARTAPVCAGVVCQVGRGFSV
jgi:hypothetical protein